MQEEQLHWMFIFSECEANEKIVSIKKGHKGLMEGGKGRKRKAKEKKKIKEKKKRNDVMF